MGNPEVEQSARAQALRPYGPLDTPAEIADTEAGWRLMFERNPLPMWVYDQETLRFMAVNDAAIEGYGWSREEFHAMTIDQIRPPEDAAALHADLALRRQGLHAPQLWRHRVRSGRLIHVEITAHSMPFAGRASRLVLAHDVSERVAAEAAVRDSEAQWRRLFEASATGIVSCTVEGRFLSANPAFLALVGRSESELQPLNILDITHLDDRESCGTGLARVARGEVETATFDKRYVRPDGSIAWAHAAVTLTRATGEKPANLVAVVQDISAPKAAQARVEKDHALIQLAGRLARIGGWAIDMPDNTLRWSDELLAILDCEPGYEPKIEEALSWYTPESLARVTPAIEACLAHGTPFDMELEIRTPRQRLLSVRVIGRALFGDNGRVLRAEGALLDQTEHKRAEKGLREQAELLEKTQDAIVVRDLEGRITYWNRAAQRIFGWTAQEALGVRAGDALGEDPMIIEAVRSELTRHGRWAQTITQLRKDGGRVTVDCRWNVLFDAAGKPNAVLAVKTDVTQRVQLEAKLQQASRLEAVGQLTGGVAHDFNNLLTVILGNADLLAEQLASQPALASLAEMTRTAAERGAELTRRLLAFARRQPLQPQAVDAHQLLASMTALLRRTLPENIELEVVRAAGQWPALVDPVQLESAVLNLVLNSRDAMPQGGKITLEALNASIDLDYAERHVDVLPGQYVMLSVSDTGEGMTPGQLTRAFEPFFTTKGAGVGSGLGLSMVYGLVKQSRGHVKLYSELGHGTTVRLYLPRADNMPDACAATPMQSEQSLRGNALVLVVEDDALVRRHACDLLIGLGYRVLSAENGPQALAVLRGRTDIELLFTDVVMPGGMNGRQLVDAALQLRPELKVLYTSGYTENAIVHHGRLDRGVQLLSKPYRSLDLARKVHAVLAPAARA